MNPCPCAVPLSLYPGLKGEGHPWPIPNDAVVHVLDRHGSPVEGARAQTAKGERVRWSPSVGVVLEGVIW